MINFTRSFYNVKPTVKMTNVHGISKRKVQIVIIMPQSLKKYFVLKIFNFQM